MRRIETKYADEGHETGLEFPDAYTLTHDPNGPKAKKEDIEQALDNLREEIISALEQRRPPVFYLPPGMKLGVHETHKTISEEDDDDD